MTVIVTVIINSVVNTLPVCCCYDIVKHSKASCY